MKDEKTLEDIKENLLVNLDIGLYQKLKALVQIAGDNEFLGFLVVKQDGTRLIIKDIYIPNQEVSSGRCEIKDNDKEIEKLILEKPEIAKDICGVLHSHGEGMPFWSKIDDVDLHEALLKYMAINKFFVSIVINNKLEMKAKLLFRSPFGDIEIDDLKVSVDIDLPRDVIKSMDEEWKNKIEVTRWASDENNVTIWREGKQMTWVGGRLVPMDTSEEQGDTDIKTWSKNKKKKMFHILENKINKDTIELKELDLIRDIGSELGYYVDDKLLDEIASRRRMRELYRYDYY